jgi:L-fucose isomerase-like protein
MKKSRLMSWGGQYGADIPYTRSDQAELENRFVKEIITEQEMCLTEKAEDILKSQPDRVEGFIRWLNTNKTDISYDGKMLTEDVLKFQIAQYFAAKDRLTELREENITGVSIKCHFEVSTRCVGCTECLIPGFMPFGFDSEGEKNIVPVACEGDLNGLVSSVLLHALKPDIPPLFGDMITYKKDYILLRNCGAASVYWARRSNRPDITLPGVRLLPNMHGKSGSAVHFETPPGDEITFSRLFRAGGRYYMYLGLGKVYEKAVENRMGITWPHTRIYFDSDHYLVYKSSPCNHGCITEGDLTGEIETFCRYTGVKVVRCDNDQSIKNYLAESACI